VVRRRHKSATCHSQPMRDGVHRLTLRRSTRIIFWKLHADFVKSSFPIRSFLSRNPRSPFKHIRASIAAALRSGEKTNGMVFAPGPPLLSKSSSSNARHCVCNRFTLLRGNVSRVAVTKDSNRNGEGGCWCALPAFLVNSPVPRAGGG
jgi:hypothetical protein